MTIESARIANTARPRLRDAIPWDPLQLALGGALILALLVLLAERFPQLLPLRAVLGAPYILFAPGYFLAFALFPRRADLDTAERMGLSLGLSIAVVPLLALLLNWLPWGIRVWPIIVAEAAVIALAIVVGVARALRLPAGAAYQPRLGLSAAGWWGELRPPERRLIAGLALALALGAGSAAWIFVASSSRGALTEFYLLGRGGLAEDFPQRAGLNDELQLTVGVTNQERRAERYRLEVWVVDSWDPSRRAKVAEQPAAELPDGQEQRWQVSWRMPWVGPDQQVEFLLFAGDQPEPYRQLRLWVDVGEGGAP